MRLYKYECNECSHVYEHLIRDSSPSPTCPSCNSSNSTKLYGGSMIKLSKHFHTGKPAAASFPSNQDTGLNGTVRMANYADKKTGKFLGHGAPEVYNGD